MTITATPRRLVELFPKSYSQNNTGEDKTNFDFVLETEAGEVFSIYDWKYYRPLDLDEVVEWHIGSKTPATSFAARAELLGML